MPRVAATPALYSRVLAALRAGSAVPPPYTPKPDDNSELLARLPLADVARIGASSRLRAMAMTAAHANDMEAAARRLRASKAMLQSDQMGPESQASALQTHYGVESYLAYRQGDFHGARRAMEEALRLVHQLENAFGYDFLDGRRVHLARNLTRLEAHGGDPLVAARRLLALAHYACGADDAWPYPELGRPSPTRRPDATERPMGFDQVARELALLYVHNDPAEAPRLTEALSSPPPRPTDGHPRMQTLHLWVALKAHAQHDARALLEASIPFLHQGPVVPALWYAVALDLALACHDAPDHAAELAEHLRDAFGTEERMRRITYERLWASPTSAPVASPRPRRVAA